MIVTLNIKRYTHDPDTHAELSEEPDMLTLQFHDGEAPMRDDHVRTEDGRSFRVEWREWLPGGLVLHVTERVQQERAA